MVKEINGTGVAVLLVEQNTQHALSLANHGYVLESGRVVLSAGGRELLANAAVRNSYPGVIPSAQRSGERGDGDCGRVNGPTARYSRLSLSTCLM